MKKFTFKLIAFMVTIWFFSVGIKATGNNQNIPPSLTHEFNYETLETHFLSHGKHHIDEAVNSKQGSPLWAGFSLKTEVVPQSNGVIVNWPNGERSWMLRATSPGAPALGLVFENAILAPNSILFVYSEFDPSFVYSITAEEIVSGYISTPPIETESLIIEYTEKSNLENSLLVGNFVITDLVVIYNGINSLNSTKDLGDSEWCQVNINCPEGANWQAQKRGVARILLREGTVWGLCSGTLINNTNQDGTPYFLTAEHCGGNASAADRNVWQFAFNYERPGCPNTGTPPNNLATGCVLRAKGPIAGGSDFQLVQLNTTPPQAWNPFYNGWSRVTQAATGGVGIHHPSGDAKKISTFTGTLVSSSPNIGGSQMASNSAWQVQWTATTTSHGVTEGGSSGSPLFNNAGLVVGTLSGGSSYCSNPNWPDYYGKFSYHWTSNGTANSSRLQPWLDPAGTGVETLNGFDPYLGINPNFYANKLVAKLNEEIIFTDLSTGGDINSWSWNFGEGAVPATATGQGPHTVYYTTPGSKTISLTVNAEHTATKADYIYIKGINTATFTVTDYDGNLLENAMITVSPTGRKIATPNLIIERENKNSTSNCNKKQSVVLGAVEQGEIANKPSTFDNPSAKDGIWIHWDNGTNYSAIGTNNVANFDIASRWEPADIAEYEGKIITKISFYPNYENCEYTLKIWTGSEAEEVYSQLVTDVVIQQWNIIELNEPYYIDVTQELWFGVNINTQGGHPAGCDAGPAVSGKGNMIFWQGAWTQLSALNPALVYNWNLQAYVDDVQTVIIYTDANGQAIFENWEAQYTYTVEKDGYEPASGQFALIGEDIDINVSLYEDDGKVTVTFNVDVTDIEDLDIENDVFFLTGSFSGWAEPGTEGSIPLTLTRKQKDDVPPYNFFESFEGFDDFTTDLTPWTTIQVTTGNTYSSNSFDFPGEGTAFAYMAFNPSQTTPSIVGNHPPVDGDKYVIAVQYVSTNDNKWLISPQISVNETSQLSFWAKSITSQYGLERIKVHVSTTGTQPADFTQISAGNYIEVPVDWTEYTFSLAAYAGQTIHVGIQYVSYDAFILMLDAFSVTAEVQQRIIYTATTRLDPGIHEYKYFRGEGWDGGEWVGTPNRLVDVEGPMVVNDIWAEYAPKYVLSLFANPVEGGTVTGEGLYTEGESVTVVASPNTGYLFVNWINDEEEVVSSNTSYTFAMPANNVNLTAIFEEGFPPTYQLTLLVNPENSGVVSGAGEYLEGETVSITATPNEGFTFLNWTKDGVEVETNPNFNYTMPAQEVTLIANFEAVPPPTYLLTLEVNPVGAGLVTGQGQYEEGEQVQITATTNNGYTFTNWTTTAGTVVSTTPSFTYTMPSSDVTLIANFEQIPPPKFTLTLNINPIGAGVVTGAGEFEEGTSVSITATANDGYAFVDWKDANQNVVSTNANFTYTMPAVNVSLTANFEVVIPTFSVTFSVFDSNGAIENASVNLSGSIIQTNNQGIAVFENIEAGTYDYYVTHNDYHPKTGQIVVVDQNVTEQVALTLVSAQINSLNLISIYPNPFEDQITIKNLKGIKSITITNLIGQKILDVSLSGNETEVINTKNLSSGIYLIVLKATNGEKIVRKVVKR